jgi:hypothetical protein
LALFFFSAIEMCKCSQIVNKNTPEKELIIIFIERHKIKQLADIFGAFQTPL